MRYQKIIKQDILPGKKAKTKKKWWNPTGSPSPNIELLLYAGIALNEHIKHRLTHSQSYAHIW